MDILTFSIYFIYFNLICIYSKKKIVCILFNKTKTIIFKFRCFCYRLESPQAHGRFYSVINFRAP